MKKGLPLSALLSQALVAFIVEFDNEFEHQTPHRTTNHGSTPGFPYAPWLVSMSMWVRYMQFVPLEGISAGEFQSLSGISRKGMATWLTRLSKWWGYLIIQPAASGSSKLISPDAWIFPTVGGKKAIAVWNTLATLIEDRWRARFGRETIDSLDKTLRALAAQFDPALPAFFSVLEYEDQKTLAHRQQAPARNLTMPELLAKALLAFAGEFEQESTASLGACANLLRCVGDGGVSVRDLLQLAFLPADGVAASLRELQRKRLGAVRADPAGTRAKMLFLTPKGILAREEYPQRAQAVEQDWQKRFGKEPVRQLREDLERLTGTQDSAATLLLREIVAYPDNWRASLPPMQGLPHFPVITHRGGFPDGS